MAEQRYTISRWVSLLYRYGQMYIGDRLKDYDIGRGQHIFLNALYKEDGLSQEELSSYLKIDKGTTAKAIKKLEEQGYVTRTIRDDDRRTYRIFLTGKALGIKDEVRGVLADWRNILSHGFTEEEKQAALDLLERMGRNAIRFTEEGGREQGMNEA
ncbi:MarR family transcriptional regulator [Paenibacillus sp. P26]|nr:MarR family transcriptional regulator [Paenibacillus sp. P26]UUZ91140.1 MarR family transcriptional regulator [Paenibacillus sp. P25]